MMLQFQGLCKVLASSPGHTEHVLRSRAALSTASGHSLHCLCKTQCTPEKFGERISTGGQ